MWDFFWDALQLRPSSQPLTSYAGLVLAQQVLRTTGFMDLAAACLPAVRANYGYAAELVLVWIMLLQRVGGRTQADIRKFRQDGLFVGQSVPTDRSLANGLDWFGTAAGMAQLRELQRLLVAWAVSPGSYVLDLDDTQVRTEKAGAQRGYNGAFGFWVETAFLAGADGMLADGLRPGNQNRPGERAVERRADA